MNRNNTQYNNIDYSLIFIVLLLGIISCFTLYTIEPTLPSKYDESDFFIHQVIWYILGSIMIVLIMLIDYDRLRQIVWFMYGAGIIALLMLHFNFPSTIVQEINHARSWFIFPGVGTIQPAEFMKVVLSITLAHVIVHHNENFKYRTTKSDLILLIKIILLALPPMILIALQPDLGSFLVLVAITACIILVSGIRWRILFSIVGMAGIGTALVIIAYMVSPGKVQNILNKIGFEHVQSRFYGWLYPETYGDSGYQLIRAKLAIGSGQMSGKGIGDFEVLSIPERHTDMIFTAIAEQFGFIGSSVLITLFFLLIYRLIYIGLQSNDQFGSLIITGIIGMFTFQIFQNIGMSIQLLPITGLPLPFIGYGGSSTMTYLLAIGIVLNIHHRTKEYMFD
ncbi:FtsW/RodA/SpoVE family cell cycle protein [Radiobacillus sp. PE A8.2]|uniref:FtsW/RodA/SpoVE family cell cycle protein n=1 Tax=Radiobacillus sp. PE A8.2 TaxID=3380349 RepID=UPI00388FD148